MEVAVHPEYKWEGLIAHGNIKAVKELLTVKSDCEEGKSDLISQLIRTGEYTLPPSINTKGGTKKVVDTLINFLQG